MKDENVHVKFVDAFLNLVNRVINLPVSSWNFFLLKFFLHNSYNFCVYIQSL
jgi:hypothetical protein